MTLWVPEGALREAFRLAGASMPNGAEDGMRRLMNRWEATAAELERMAQRLTRTARVMLAEQSESTRVAAESALLTAEQMGEQAAFCRDKAAQCRDGANATELAKWLGYEAAALFVVMLAADIWMLGPGTAKMAGDRAAFRLTLRQIWQQLLREIAAIAPARAVPQVTRAVSRFAWDAVRTPHVTAVGLGGGINGAMNAGTQIGQVLAGHRDGLDWEGVGESVASGAVGGWAGARFALRTAPMLGRAVGRIGWSPARRTALALGRLTIGAGSGAVGGAAGLAVPVIAEHRMPTLAELGEALYSGIGGGFLGATAGAYAAQRHLAAVHRLDDTTPSSAPAQRGSRLLHALNALAGRRVAEVPDRAGPELSHAQLQARLNGRMLRQPDYEWFADRVAEHRLTAVVSDGPREAPYLVTVVDGDVVRIDPDSTGPPPVWRPTGGDGPYAIVLDRDFEPLDPLDEDIAALPQTEHTIINARETQFRRQFVAHLELGRLAEAGETVRHDQLAARLGQLEPTCRAQSRAQLELHHYDREIRKRVWADSFEGVNVELSTLIHARNRAAEDVYRLSMHLDAELAELPNDIRPVEPDLMAGYCAPAAVLDLRHITGNASFRPLTRGANGTALYEVGMALGAHPEAFPDHHAIDTALLRLGHGAAALVGDDADEGGHAHLRINYQGTVVIRDWYGAAVHDTPAHHLIRTTATHAFLIDSFAAGSAPVQPMSSARRNRLQELDTTVQRLARETAAMRQDLADTAYLFGVDPVDLETRPARVIENLRALYSRRDSRTELVDRLEQGIVEVLRKDIEYHSVLARCDTLARWAVAPDGVAGSPAEGGTARYGRSTDGEPAGPAEPDRWPSPAEDATDAEYAAASRAWLRFPGGWVEPEQVAYPVADTVAAARDRGVRVAEWFNSLDDDAKRGMRLGYTDRIRNLEGIPSAVRDEANRRALARGIASLETAWLEGALGELPRRHFVAGGDLRDLVDAADRLAMRAGQPQSQLLTLHFDRMDGTEPGVEIVFGDLDSAQAVGVHVLPAQSPIAGVQAELNATFEHFANLRTLEPGDDSAVVLRTRTQQLGTAGAVGERRWHNELTGRSLLADLAARNAVWEALHPDRARTMNVVVLNGSSALVGYAGRQGRFGEAGVTAVTYWRAQGVGPLDHAAEFGVEQVFALGQPRPSINTSGLPPRTAPGRMDFGAVTEIYRTPGAPAERTFTGELLAEVTAGHHNRVFDGNARSIEGLRDAVAGAEAIDEDDLNAVRARTQRSAAAHELLVRAARSHPEVLALLRQVNPAFDGGAAPGVLWFARDWENRRPEAGVDTELAALDKRAAAMPDGPPVRMLRRSDGTAGMMLAIGHTAPDSVVLYVGDATVHGSVGLLGKEIADVRDAGRMWAPPDSEPRMTTVIGYNVRGAQDAPELARQIAQLRGELHHQAASGHKSPPRLLVIAEGAGAAAMHAAAAGGALSQYVQSLLYVDAPRALGHTAEYGISAVFETSRYFDVAHIAAASPDELLHPAFAGKRLEYNEHTIGLFAADRIADLSEVLYLGTESANEARHSRVHHADQWVARLMNARDWQEKGQVHDARAIVAELTDPELSTAPMSIRVGLSGSFGSRELEVVATYAGGADWLPEDLWVTNVLADNVVADTMVSAPYDTVVIFRLHENRWSSAHILSDEATVRSSLPNDPPVTVRETGLARAAGEKWEAAVDAFLADHPARNPDDPAEQAVRLASAGASAFHALDWNERQARIRADALEADTVLGATPTWKDRNERLAVTRRLVELTELGTLQDEELVEWRNLNALGRSLVDIDRTAAALRTSAYLLAFEPELGYVHVAFGNTGLATRVDVYIADGMPMRMIGPVTDHLGRRHGEADQDTATVLHFSVNDQQAMGFRAQADAELEHIRRYYAGLSDGNPEPPEFHYRVLDSTDLLDISMHRYYGPMPGAGNGAAPYARPDANLIAVNHLLEGNPHDSAALVLRVLARATPPGAVDVHGLEGRLGGMHPVEWARRAHANFHPGGFESAPALAARLKQRIGTLAVGFTDGPHGARPVLYRNASDGLQRLDPTDIPRHEVHAFAFDEIDFEQHWQDWVPSHDSPGTRYAAVFEPDGVAERPLLRGRLEGLPGIDRPEQWIGEAVYEPFEPHPTMAARPDSPSARHATPSNDCGPEALHKAYELTRNPNIALLQSDSPMVAAGLDAEEFARYAGGDWKPDGFATLDEAADHVDRNGGVVLAAIEYRGLADRNNGVGAHVVAIYRKDGLVWVHEKANGVVLDYRYAWGEQAPDVRGVYGIVYRADGSATNPLTDGSSSAAAGTDRPETRLGAI
ncbi:MAG: hypothetical protein HOQ24_14055 [Mycobacteriaceae bacterium]|nr:hypothetical protein [Mycobacteriaceae bacterium]